MVTEFLRSVALCNGPKRWFASKRSAAERFPERLKYGPNLAKFLPGHLSYVPTLKTLRMNATVPFDRSALSTTANQAALQRPAAGGLETGKKVLIVDDNLVILKVLSSKLRANGYRVMSAIDGSEAVSTVRRERPELILLDINFPPDVSHGGGVGWDGFLIMSWLRRMDEAVNTPVIIITGTSPETSRERCRKAGVSGYFQKPIQYDDLLRTINNLIGPAQDSTVPLPTGSGKRVLVVDDENDWRFMASVYLKEAGFDVSLASNGSEALETIKKAAPDLVLLDLNLAGKSGLEVMESLKEQNPSLRVLLYTGMNHEPTEIEAMLKLGAHQYLRKSTMGEMLKAVQNAVAA